MNHEPTLAKVQLTDGLGLGPERADFADVCAMLPDGVNWGDPLTPALAREIVEAAVAAERESIKARLMGMDAFVKDRHNYYSHAAWVLFGRA